MKRGLIIAGAGVGLAYMAVYASTIFPALKPKRAASVRLTRGEVDALVHQIDLNRFRGWFNQGGRLRSDVTAVIQIESDFETGANGDNGEAHGLGQIHASTAADMGVYSVEQLYDPYTNILTAMKYLKWIWETLTNWLKQTPKMAQWIGAYNAGVGNVSGLNGAEFIPLSYVNRWKSAAGR